VEPQVHIPVIYHRNGWHNGRFFVTFGEISYLVTDKKNRNDQELGLILPGNFIENAVIDKKVSLKKIIHQK
jgi:hypothetical protein